jgi:hypothetical protein
MFMRDNKQSLFGSKQRNGHYVNTDFIECTDVNFLTINKVYSSEVKRSLAVYAYLCQHWTPNGNSK